MKSKVLIFLVIVATIFSFSVPSFAVYLADVRVNGIYYHEAWNDNNRVRVLSIQGNKVEVVFLEGSNAGEVDLVYSGKLLRRTESEKEEFDDAMQGAGLAVGAIAIIACALSDDCE
jgi:hypothetical protein